MNNHLKHVGPPPLSLYLVIVKLNSYLHTFPSFMMSHSNKE